MDVDPEVPTPQGPRIKRAAPEHDVEMAPPAKRLEDEDAQSPPATNDDLCLYKQNEGFELVHGLPGTPRQPNSEVDTQVQALIAEEMGNFEPRDYLASLQPPEMKMLNAHLQNQGCMEE
eukprot:gnl/MRDRNA2_/MRDRNA2_43228_c0_seq1.p2 gnl/MRDRNA2_/MRDRNA2_43228_c0~~gnl/MRDRNA2_/MRDRNA2_43228_c0_seq1.p2  ORF type:complete len:119 (+),score=37.03 gnl/MRDRNA2_/MRDRNA2_43228_c0_seq1:69-425(+)